VTQPALDADLLAALSDAAPGNLESLAACRHPFLIGVRHHSPVLAAAVPALLDTLNPDLVLIELPEELQPWLQWLGADELQAPVALAAARADGGGLLFYPFADFSPELAAIRWAARHAVPVEAFDLPVARSTAEDSTEHRIRLAPEVQAPLTRALEARLGVAGQGDLWDHLVEARAAGAEPEAVRRAALAVGWALRLEQSTWGEVPAIDLTREAWMRSRLTSAHEQGVLRPAAVIGAFHAPALLLPETQPSPRPEKGPRTRRAPEIVTSLVPYAFELLDSRTGYPAGIRDPEWQQALWAAGCTPEAATRATQGAVLRICRVLRDLGLAAGVPDARETARLAVDLARLRGLNAPGRAEVVEAIRSGLAQGEPLGRGRAVDAATQRVLIGRRRGRLAPATPRSGLTPHVEALVAELRLPGPTTSEPLDIRLDPLRSELDRRRYVTIQRLIACAVPYAEPVSVDPDHLTSRWQLNWTPQTSALLELAGLRGVTLAQAAEGVLRTRRVEAERAQRLTARIQLGILESAAECGLAAVAEAELYALVDAFRAQAGLTELLDAVELVDRIGRGHVPGYDPPPATRDYLAGTVQPTLIGAALNQVDGLTGSARDEDARALLALVQRLQRGDAGALVLGDTRLRWALEHLERDGSPLMQGAGGALRVVLGHAEAETFGERMGSWVDAAASLPGASVSDERAGDVLAARLRGALLMAAPLLEAAPAVTSHLIERVDALDDEAFLATLPALREAFDVLAPAARQRFLNALRPIVGDVDLRLDFPPALLAQWAVADQAGRQAAQALDPHVLIWGSAP